MSYSTHLNDQIKETLLVLVELKFFGIVITNTYIAIHVIQTNINKILSFEIRNSYFYFSLDNIVNNVIKVITNQLHRAKTYL